MSQNNSTISSSIEESSQLEQLQVIQTNLNLESEAFNLDFELARYKPSRIQEFRYRYSDFWSGTNKFFLQHPLIGYSFRRIIYGLITLLIAIILLFIIIRSVTNDIQYLPANYQSLKLSDKQLEELLVNRMKLFGVYGPMGQQLANYLRNLCPFIPKDILVFDYYEFSPDGSSIVYWEEIFERRWVYLGVTSSPSIADSSTDVMTLFNKAIPYSFVFGSIAVVISYLIGIPLGIEAAKKKGKPSDSIINASSITLIAVPAVVIVIGIYLLSVAGFNNSGLFSSGAFATRFWPIVVLVLMMMPSTVVLTRRYVVDEMTSDYARFALSKGMTNNKVYYVHIFRNAGIRILKQFPLDLAVTLFGASILTEQQWGIPGMGRYIVSAVSGDKDSFVILGYVSFAAFVTVFSSLISDLLMVGLDPRVKLTK
ncbi:oligopeptide transport system permease protein [Entomoplasma freundtii]|uniref:Oligopeptide ABC transporter permease n=1 Tax=Entomoplasma freundtii TaxID=74700 RepID=A0A2K8NRT2_9MOLU|nr:oligopeptide ABC transporter permease OppB [Entomoplasma freundtii]ATZ16562.1 oligopeptide ABC transporter permease [Entomoplasma freundtii]TDY58272.1 oligopeptide transport system permease protein [Entomoplasma freundtii]